MAKTNERRSEGRIDGAGPKQRQEEQQVKKMTRYPPSLNGINKNLP